LTLTLGHAPVAPKKVRHVFGSVPLDRTGGPHRAMAIHGYFQLMRERYEQ
jgi:hypothetical protein